MTSSDTSGLTRFTRGQHVVLPAGVLGTVVETARARGLVRANTPDGFAAGWHDEDTVRTRSEALHALRATLRAIAHDIGHTPLEEAVNALEAPLREAALVADSHDATRGIA
jgi:hypothetical protein